MIIVLIGPSGVGKDSILKKLLTWNKSLATVVTHTSRNQRDDEKNGIDYHFMERSSFEMMAAREEFIEYNEYNGNLYGTTISSLKDVESSDRHPIIILDINGADAFIEKYDNVVSIFIEPPSIDILRKRLKKRGDKEDEIERRIHIAEDEVCHAFKYTYRITNDNLSQAATRALGCIHKHVY